ncbi:MAG: hypothetical protein KBT69_06685, partial [Oceanihabitans sp.]|nr:hypothetical protein [Oceanihabitans sp.]
MSKKLFPLLIVLSFIYLGCSSLNEFGKRRNGFNLEKIKANSDPKAYSIIDTSKVYWEILTINTIDKS